MPRLFIAIDLPDSIVGMLASLSEPAEGLRWTRAHQYHLTLRFLGDTPEARIPPLIEALQAIDLPASTLRLRGVGAFPNAGRARVLWAGIDADDTLQPLHDEIERGVRTAGLPGQEQRFHPHVTLARIKRMNRPWVAGFLREHEPLRSEPFMARAFTLYQSVLNPTGAVHTPLRVFQLGVYHAP